MAISYPSAVERFPRLRQSLLATFSDCHLAGAFDLRLAIAGAARDGLHVSGWSTHPQTRGQIAHRVIARQLEIMFEEGEERPDPSLVMDLLDEELRQADRPPGETAALPAREIRQLRRTLRKWARDNEFTVEEFAGIEKRLEATVAYPDGAGDMVERVLTGQLDLLLIDPTHEHATVVDWKDTWKLPTERHRDDEDYDGVDDGADDTDDALSTEGYFQQRFYALLVLLVMRSVQSVTLREFYIRRSETREATLWRSDLPDLMAEFAALAEQFDRCYEEQPPQPADEHVRMAAARLVDALERGESAEVAAEGVRRALAGVPEQALHRTWAPSPGAHCSYCPLAVECPIEPNAREGGAITNPDQAQRAIGQMLKARRVATQISKSVQTFCDRFGPVRIRDGKRVRFFGFITSTRVERPTAEELDRALARGNDPRKLYRRRTQTRFTDFTPEQGDLAAVEDDEDVVAQFEHAAELARQRRRSGKRRSRV